MKSMQQITLTMYQSQKSQQDQNEGDAGEPERHGPGVR